MLRNKYEFKKDSNKNAFKDTNFTYVRVQKFVRGGGLLNVPTPSPPYDNTPDPMKRDHMKYQFKSYRTGLWETFPGFSRVKG